MNQAWLKKIRVMVSLVFLPLATVLFVDFDRIGDTPDAVHFTALSGEGEARPALLCARARRRWSVWRGCRDHRWSRPSRATMFPRDGPTLKPGRRRRPASATSLASTHRHRPLARSNERSL